MATPGPSTDARPFNEQAQSVRRGKDTDVPDPRPILARQQLNDKPRAQQMIVAYDSIMHSLRSSVSNWTHGTSHSAQVHGRGLKGFSEEEKKSVLDEVKKAYEEKGWKVRGIVKGPFHDYWLQLEAPEGVGADALFKKAMEDRGREGKI
ncbi:hypothetical protein HK097_001766 [Rhizophlyctis rosea]|uniref:Uncharacterized protein n=1 Tax=Rhizophlyctis rosea TaxID=64517 RepID=A0AAD5X0L0_9FUNG|nr:hypothetical protein HK097_001766 [Rhizophlyctis rosea]